MILEPTIPSLNEIKKANSLILQYINKTPIFKVPLNATLTPYIKYELFQHSGTFKTRGALISILTLSKKERLKGVICASAGNHAIAVSYAGSVLKTKVKAFIPKSADPLRIELCKKYGAEIVFAESLGDALEKAKLEQTKTGQCFIHPFEGRSITLGTATLGYEIIKEVPDCDAIIVPVGGGGLLSGIALVAHYLNQKIKVYGVEPSGSNAMQESFIKGKPAKLEKMNTIADSLSTPYTLPFSYSICKKYAKEIVTVSDDEIMRAMYILYREAKIVSEPATATALAGFLSPLKNKLKKKKVVVIACGANLNFKKYSEYIDKGSRSS